MTRKTLIVFTSIEVFLVLMVTTGLFIASNHTFVLSTSRDSIPTDNIIAHQADQSEVLWFPIISSTEESSSSTLMAYVFSSTSQISINSESSNQASSSSSTQSVSPDACPQTTQSCVPCTTSEQYCRFEEGETSGYLGWACQNNNPGNIKYSDYRIGIITAMGGAAPCGEKGGFMVFSSYNQGRNSVKAYIQGINEGYHTAYHGEGYSCGDCTLLQFYTHYAPNNPVGYTNGIVAKMGSDISPETKLNWLISHNRLDELMDAMQQMEGFFTQ